MNYFEWQERFATIACVVAAILVIAVITAGVVSSINNASNEIFAGIIIDKYTSGGYFVRGYKFPKAWNFVIQGTKNGETVNYHFEVTEEEYGRYKTGDYYER